MNGLKTALLLGAMTALILGIGHLAGGVRGMTVAFAIAIVMNFVSYWFSDKIVLAMYRAKPVTAQEMPELYNMVQELTMKAQMPMPRLYVIPTDAPNAFATGRNPKHAAVAVTQGILQLLNREELKGVIGHELSHVLNRDILISSVAATIAGAIMMVSRVALFFGHSDDDEGGNPIAMIFMIILAPIAAMLIQFAISRSREFAADDRGASIAGHPAGLASALEKLHFASQRKPLVASPSTAHLFIAKPFTGRSLSQLFSTHPPMEKRVARLKEKYGNW